MQTLIITTHSHHDHALLVHSIFPCFMLHNRLVLISDAQPKRPAKAASYRDPLFGCSLLIFAPNGRRFPCQPSSTSLYIIVSNVVLEHAER